MRPGGLHRGSRSSREAWSPFHVRGDRATYLLYLDESGTHGASPVFIVGGIAVHERDAWHLQSRLERVLTRRLPAGFAPQDFELHAADIKAPKKAGRRRPASEWLPIPYAVRLEVLRETYAAIARYQSLDSSHPVALFGAVVERTYSDWHERAYEEVLHKFDELLTRQGHANVPIVHVPALSESEMRPTQPEGRRLSAELRPQDSDSAASE